MSGAGGDVESGPVKHINLALQGGGAHGAYSWGVLDRLLEDPRIVIEAVSGTSAALVPRQSTIRLPADSWVARFFSAQLSKVFLIIIKSLFQSLF